MNKEVGFLTELKALLDKYDAELYLNNMVETAEVWIQFATKHGTDYLDLIPEHSEYLDIDQVLEDIK